MKKTLLMLSSVVVMLGLGITQAYAVSVPPVTDGILGVGEWANLAHGGGPYPYFLEVGDPDEADNQIQNMDLSHGVLLQELNLAGGDGDPDVLLPLTGGLAGDNDGVYLLLEVYGPPPSLAFATGVGVVPTTAPVILMSGDFLGDGLLDPFNIFLRHYNTLPGAGAPVGSDVVEACIGSLASCSGILGGPYTLLTAVGGSFGRGAVLEYFIPSSAFLTPIGPFPGSFIGTITYDNGASGPLTSDDVVIGSLLIPEPSTIMLTVTGLLGMLGFGKFKFWN